MKKIAITAGQVTMPAELNESETAQKIWDVLPLEGRANIWGDEIYFEIPVILAEAADARALVDVGDLGYWPVGHAFCIFYGRTPVSSDDRPRAYSPVNIFGRVIGDATAFRAVQNGAPVRISAAAD